MLLNTGKEYTLKMCRDVTKGALRMKIKIEFCIACSREHSDSHFVTKIMYLEQFFTELLRTLPFKTCIMKKLNLLSKLISKSYVQLHSTIKT